MELSVLSGLRWSGIERISLGFADSQPHPRAHHEALHSVDDGAARPQALAEDLESAVASSFRNSGVGAKCNPTLVTVSQRIGRKLLFARFPQPALKVSSRGALKGGLESKQFGRAVRVCDNWALAVSSAAPVTRGMGFISEGCRGLGTGREYRVTRPARVFSRG